MFGNMLGTQKMQFSLRVGEGKTTDNLKDQAFHFGDHFITSHKRFSDDAWILLREYWH